MNRATPMHRPQKQPPFWRGLEPADTTALQAIKAYLKSHPGEELSADDIFEKFGYPAAKVHTLLQKEVSMNRIKRRRGDYAEYVYTYEAPAAMPTFDPTTVKLLDNQPLPKPHPPTANAWTELLRRMKPGQSTEALPLHTLKSAERAIRDEHKKTESRFTRRSNSKAGTYAIWRTK